MAQRRPRTDKTRLMIDSAALSDSSMSSKSSQTDINASSTAKHDPDPFTAVCMVLGGLAAIAQIVHVAHSMWPKETSRVKAVTEFITELGNDLEDLIRDIERLQRFLRQYNTIDGQPVLDAASEFGSAPMILGSNGLSSYQRAVDSLASDVMKLNARTIGVIRFHPEFASQVGAEILLSFADILPRINQLRDLSIGDGLDTSLEILREIERIVNRLTPRDLAGN